MLASKDADMPPHDCGALFGRHLPHILRSLNLWPATGIVALTLLDTYLVSYLGQVAGLFYQAFINQDVALFRRSILYAVALYIAATLLSASTKALGDYLALIWRTSLAARLHRLYCRHLGTAAADKCDTPEQRISADVQQLTAALADAAHALAAAPFQAMLYAALTARAFGSWLPCGVALLFFLLGAALQRVLMGPVARRVYSQEAREGALRAALHHASGHSLEIALWGGQPVEHAHMEACYQAAARNQFALLLRVWALTCSTKMLEYLGALLNYLCLGLAIFTGLGGHKFPADPGKRAGAVSNASFFLITLLYSFTKLLDAAATASKVAGLAARVSQLLQVLELADGADGGSSGAAGGADGDESARRAASGAFAAAGLGAARSLGPSECPSVKPGTDGEPSVAEPLLKGWGGGLGAEAGEQPSGGVVKAAGAARRAPVTLLADGGVPLGAPGRRAPGDGGTAPARPPPGAAEGAAPVPGAAGSSGTAAPGSQPAARPAPVAETLQPPACQALAAGRRMEVSVHAVRSSELRRNLALVFPEAPSTSPLLAAVTFQLPPAPPAGPPDPVWLLDGSSISISSSSSSDDSSSAGSDQGPPGGPAHWQQEMDGMLRVFLEWQAAACEHLTGLGHWADAVDPRTGRAMRGRAGATYSEVLGAQVFLGYEREGSRSCPLVRHPECGRWCYPATLFTSAPAPLLHAALSAAHDHCRRSLAPCPPPAPQHSGTVLSLREAEVRTPGQQLVAACLSVELRRGGMLMLTGPSGCGKSTLVACLAGLQPLAAGDLWILPRSQVMFVPQQLLPAPGATLGHQLAYPHPDPPPTAQCRQLLQAACLPHLIPHLDAAAEDATAGQAASSALAGAGAQVSAGSQTGAGAAGAADAPKAGIRPEAAATGTQGPASGQATGGGDDDTGAQEAAPGQVAARGVRHWASSLSPGELQRLQIARLLLHRPALAVLDEAFSGVGAEVEGSLLEALAAQGTAVLLVTHRISNPSRPLAPRLHLLGDGVGGWRLV